MSAADHIPVMLNEVIEALKIVDHGVYIDCTFGAGGYSKKILSSAACKLYAIDQDPNVQKFVQEIDSSDFTFINDNFANLLEISARYKLGEVDGIVFDLGVSSMQVDQADRGFSFNKDARLDMRMSGKGIDAWQVVNEFSEEDLADIFYYYGEEMFARRIARKIVSLRKTAPINTTLELANIVHSCVRRQGKIDSATKTFQALRVYVNDEIRMLKKALESAYKLLKNNGVIVVVSFQGLEDRIVKDFAKQYQNLSTKLIKPTSAEIKENPRARSAKLRFIRKCEELWLSK